MGDCTTQHLVALAKQGDEAALNRLCSVYGERVRRLVRLRLDHTLRSKLDSVDVVQDALVSAMDGLKDFSYKNEGDFLRWLAKIAENRLRDVFDGFHACKRDVHKEIPFKQEDRSTSGHPGPALSLMRTTTPSVIACRKEAMDRLERALDELKPEYKEVIVLKKIEGLSHAEIAERLGKNTGAVRMLLARAMAALTLSYGDE